MVDADHDARDGEVGGYENERLLRRCDALSLSLKSRSRGGDDGTAHWNGKERHVCAKGKYITIPDELNKTQCSNKRTKQTRCSVHDGREI